MCHTRKGMGESRWSGALCSVQQKEFIFMKNTIGGGLLILALGSTMFAASRSDYSFWYVILPILCLVIGLEFVIEGTTDRAKKEIVEYEIEKIRNEFQGLNLDIKDEIYNIKKVDLKDLEDRIKDLESKNNL